MFSRQPLPAFSGNQPFSRRSLLNAAAMMPFAPLALRAQNSGSLWDSARIMIGSGGVTIATDLVQCELFDPNGNSIPGGRVTVDTNVLATSGVAKFKWEISGGKLQCSFRLPDPNPSGGQVLAFAPAPGGPPNRFYLLISDDHLLAADDPNFIADGVFHGVSRLITKCQYLVDVDQNSTPHPVAPFCTNCVYIFIGV